MLITRPGDACCDSEHDNSNLPQQTERFTGARNDEIKYGLLGRQPAEPHVPFFVKYHDCGVNLLLQSIAKEKQEHEAKLRAEAEKHPDASPRAARDNLGTQKHRQAIPEQVEAAP